MIVAEHILARRAGYSHHGIYIGEGRVIHFTGEPKSKKDARVAESSLADFALGCDVLRVTYRSRNPPDQALRLARSQVGSSGYNLVFNNCEHFAVWCISGNKRSLQVEGVAKAVLAAGPFGGVRPLRVTGTVAAAGLRGALLQAAKVGGLAVARVPVIAATSMVGGLLGVGLVAAVTIARDRSRMEPFNPDGPFDYSGCNRTRVYPGAPKAGTRVKPGRDQ